MIDLAIHSSKLYSVLSIENLASIHIVDKNLKMLVVDNVITTFDTNIACNNG